MTGFVNSAPNTLNSLSATLVLNAMRERALLGFGIVLVLAAVPCLLHSLGDAFAYSDWIGLDEKNFPIAAVHRSAEMWMAVSMILQSVGAVFMGMALRNRLRERRGLLVLSTLTAFLPTVFLVLFLH